MRRTRALVALVALACVAPFTSAADAAEPEPPGTVLISTDLSDYPSISLSPGRIVWNGVADGGQVLTRALSSDGETVTLGPQSTIGPTGGRYWGSMEHSSSGARTLYRYKFPGGAVRTVLADGGATTTLSSGAPVRMSGNRALYERDGFRIYDLHTRKTLDVSTRYTTRKDPSAADLFGNNLVYLGRDLKLYLKNLSNGAAPAAIARPGIPQGLNVFAYGDWVAWDGYLDDGTGLPADYCGIRNIRTMAPTTSFDCGSSQYRAGLFRDLTSAGAIYRTDIDYTHATWSLRRYNGTVTTLPVPESTTDLEVNGNLMAWVDADGLHAAPLPNPPTNRPRSLGDPVTKATDVIGGTSWPFRLVTTAPLSRCQVQISKARVVLRQLDCDTSHRFSGEVLARWDSRNSHGDLVGPGTFRWTAYAANADGSMLRSDGAAKPTTGTLTLTH